jgi:hypothetical protein
MRRRRLLGLLAAATLALPLGCGGGGGSSDPYNALLAGIYEVPPVTAASAGLYSFDVAEDWVFYMGSLAGVDPADVLGAHVHLGAPGENGPILFTLSTEFFVRSSDGYQDTEGTLVTDDLSPQPGLGIETFADAVAAIREGRTYVNVHTVANPGGEIRGAIEAGRATRVRPFRP